MSEQYPVLPLRTHILMPGVVMPLEVGRIGSTHAIDFAESQGIRILVVPQLDSSVDQPDPAQLCEVGVLADIVQVIKHDARRYTAIVRGVERVSITEWVSGFPYRVAIAESLTSTIPDDDDELAELIEKVRFELAAILEASSDDEEDSDFESVWQTEDADELVNLAAVHSELSRDDELTLLRETNPVAALQLMLVKLTRITEVLRVTEDIREELADADGGSAREKLLRERMRAIRDELGESDSDSEADELLERVDASKMSDEAAEASRRELRRMRSMDKNSPQFNVGRTYVEALLDIPWGIHTEDTLDVPAARAILDADHAGLAKVKKRILEFIAVRKLAPHKKGPIICLVGPPGVGKTSLGRAIAQALGRKYVRASLGGVSDEAAIRGHRRTYIGALPGRIASSLKKAEAMNPVFVLDEIDKLGRDHRGDPTSAMLEVLDPEQNYAFSDHYLEVPLDLSKIMFLATANRLDTIPAPLLDRMEVIRVPGYTLNEKAEIATKHLIPKQMAEHGLTRDAMVMGPDILADLIAFYTREAGVRNLEREIAALCRSTAVHVASGKGEELTIDSDKLTELLGPPRFVTEAASAVGQVGIATGMAWTPTGGDILFLEARAMPGTGRLRLTGQVGDVMSESMTAAMSLVRSRATEFGIDSKKLAALDVHIHVPSGGVPKDGPSAGVAITSALVSLLTDVPVRGDVSITGEITLRGRVLPVGGIKEKVLAAHRAGIKTVLLPERNRKDTMEIPEEVRSELELKFASTIDEALAVALGASVSKPAAATPAAAPPPSPDSSSESHPSLSC